MRLAGERMRYLVPQLPYLTDPNKPTSMERAMATNKKFKAKPRVGSVSLEGPNLELFQGKYPTNIAPRII